MGFVSDKFEQLVEILKASYGAGDGAIVSEALGAHTPNSDRSLATSRSKISVSGTLQTVNLEVLSGTVRVGQCHSRVILEDENQTVKATLCRGYVYHGHEIYGAGALAVKAGDYIRVDTRCSVSNVILRPIISLKRGIEQPAGWTGTDKGSLEGRGALRSVAGTNPAVGAEISEAIPTNARWLMRGVKFELDTTAGGSDRRVSLVFNDGTNNLTRMAYNAIHAASNNIEYHFIAGYPSTATEAVVRMCFLPEDLMFLQSWLLTTLTTNMAAQDDYLAPRLTVEEWIEE